MAQVFAEIFDPVIEERHNGYNPRTMKHPTDLDASKVRRNTSSHGGGGSTQEVASCSPAVEVATIRGCPLLHPSGHEPLLTQGGGLEEVRDT